MWHDKPPTRVPYSRFNIPDITNLPWRDLKYGQHPANQTFNEKKEIQVPLRTLKAHKHTEQKLRWRNNSSQTTHCEKRTEQRQEPQVDSLWHKANEKITVTGLDTVSQRKTFISVTSAGSEASNPTNTIANKSHLIRLCINEKDVRIQHNYLNTAMVIIYNYQDFVHNLKNIQESWEHELIHQVSVRVCAPGIDGKNVATDLGAASHRHQSKRWD